MDEQRLAILIVDDSTYQREMLGEHLRRAGHQITLAQHGAQALSLLRRGGFDLVLLDLDMPVMGGFELLQIRQRTPELQRIPVIIVSGADDRHLLKGLELGAEDYLCKPISTSLLALKIAKCMQIHGRRGQPISAKR